MHVYKYLAEFKSVFLSVHIPSPPYSIIIMRMLAIARSNDDEGWSIYVPVSYTHLTLPTTPYV